MFHVQCVYSKKIKVTPPHTQPTFRFVSYPTPSTEHRAHKLHRLTNTPMHPLQTWSYLYFESAHAQCVGGGNGHACHVWESQSQSVERMRSHQSLDSTMHWQSHIRGRGRSAGGSCARGRWAIRMDRRMVGWPSRRVSRQAGRSAASSVQVAWSIWNLSSALRMLRP